MGSLFITVGTYMSFYRKKFITTDFRKMVETGMFGLITISLMTGMIVFVSECYDLPAEESETYFNQWNCPDK